VCDEQGTPIAGLLMASANQEHGILAWPAGGTPADIGTQFPVGTRLRVLPNHACATAAQFPAYAVLGKDGQVQTWPRFYGW
jgi:D-serine deaminase-like pyridoxal phosphate-dependent protein